MVGQTKGELLRSTHGPLPGQRKHVPVIDPKSGQHRVALPHAGVTHQSHGIQPVESTNTKHFLGKPPLPKQEHTVSAHSGMHHTDHATKAHIQGFSATQVAMASDRATLAEKNPLAKPPAGQDVCGRDEIHG
jgi:hypothetical protein